MKQIAPVYKSLGNPAGPEMFYIIWWEIIWCMYIGS